MEGTHLEKPSLQGTAGHPGTSSTVTVMSQQCRAAHAGETKCKTRSQDNISAELSGRDSYRFGRGIMRALNAASKAFTTVLPGTSLSLTVWKRNTFLA